MSRIKAHVYSGPNFILAGVRLQTVDYAAGRQGYPIQKEGSLKGALHNDTISRFRRPHGYIVRPYHHIHAIAGRQAGGKRGIAQLRTQGATG